MKKPVIFFAAFLVVFGLVLGHLITTTLGFNWTVSSFENVPFEWDDDHDEYILSIRETNAKGLDSIVHYSVPTKKAILVCSEDIWSCYGDIVSYYNAFGRLLEKRVNDFHINLHMEAKE